MGHTLYIFIWTHARKFHYHAAFSLWAVVCVLLTWGIIPLFYFLQIYSLIMHLSVIPHVLWLLAPLIMNVCTCLSMKVSAV